MNGYDIHKESGRGQSFLSFEISLPFIEIIRTGNIFMFEQNTELRTKFKL